MVLLTVSGIDTKAAYDTDSASAEQKAVEKFMYQALYNDTYAGVLKDWGYYADNMFDQFNRLGISSSIDNDDETIPHKALLTKEFHDKFYKAFRTARGNHAKYRNQEIINYLPDPEMEQFLDYLYPSEGSTPKGVNIEITDIEVDGPTANVTCIWNDKCERHFTLAKENGQWRISDLGLVKINPDGTWAEDGMMKAKVEAFPK